MSDEPINPAHKKWIDEASYQALLERWRNAPVGDSIFQGATGNYYAEAMKKRRTEVGDDEHTRASKNIGWEGR